MDRLIDPYRIIARVVAWVGILAIIYLSVVPAVDRPVTGAGQWLEHFMAFAPVAAAFSIGYRFSPVQLLLQAFLFCGGIEFLQVPLPTRHARVSDFVVDFVSSCLAIGFVLIGEKLLHVQSNRSHQK
jgi:VanZ family protein